MQKYASLRESKNTLEKMSNEAVLQDFKITFLLNRAKYFFKHGNSLLCQDELSSSFLFEYLLHSCANTVHEA